MQRWRRSFMLLGCALALTAAQCNPAPRADDLGMAQADGGADLAGGDLAWPDLAPRDMSTPDMPSLDLAIPDMATPDLAIPDMAAPDLATPDTATPDLRAPDLSVPDLLTPDLASVDLSTRDLATPDLFTPDLTPSPDLGARVCTGSGFGPRTPHRWSEPLAQLLTPTPGGGRRARHRHTCDDGREAGCGRRGPSAGRRSLGTELLF